MGESSSSRDTVLRNLITALLVAVIGGCLTWLRRPQAEGVLYFSDFDHLYGAARLMLQGMDPYAQVGPGLVVAWPYPLLYPLPALLIVAPFTVLPIGIANAVFFGAGSGVLGYVALRERARLTAIVASGTFFVASKLVQWSPWVTAAALSPVALGWVFAAKPTIGAAMWCYRLDPRALLPPALLTAVAFAVQPDWVRSWLGVAFTGLHPIPVLQPGGFLLLLGLLRWRRPEARLLVALACVPQNMSLHETLPLFLIPNSAVQGTVLAVLSWASAFLLNPLKQGATPFSFVTGGEQYMRETLVVSAPLNLALLFLPCVLMVMRRPNEGAVPPWLERISARLPAFLRGETG